MELAVAGHVHPQGFAAVLNQDRGPGVLENNVVFGIAPVQLGLNFGVQVVVAVLGLPVAAGHAQTVLDRAVGPVAQTGIQAGVKLVNQGQLLPMLPAVGIETFGKGAPDALLVVRPAEVNEPLQVGMILFNMSVRRHKWIIPAG